MADAIIEIFTGRLGGGKTYSAVERVIQLFRQGGICYTNVQLNMDYIKPFIARKYGIEIDCGKQYVYLDNGKIGSFHNHVSAGSDEIPALVLIDEAHLFFNSRDWSKTSRDVLTFLTQTRKVRINVIMITQHQDNIDKQFRRLVQYYWTFRDMKKFRLPLLGIYWPLNQILQVCIDGQDGKTIMHKIFKHKDKDIFNCYESKSLLVDLHLKKLSDADKPQIKKLKKSFPMKYIIIIFFLLCSVGVYLFFSKTTELADKYYKTPEQQAQVQQSPQLTTEKTQMVENQTNMEEKPQLKTIKDVIRPALSSFGHWYVDANNWTTRASFNDGSYITNNIYFPIEGIPSKISYNEKTKLLTIKLTDDREETYHVVQSIRAYKEYLAPVVEVLGVAQKKDGGNVPPRGD